MESKEPIAAEEFEELPTTQEYINQRFREEFKRDYYQVIHQEHNFNHDFIEEFTYKVMQEYAVLFAKHHRKEMIEAIGEMLYKDYDGIRDKDSLLIDLENPYREERIV